MPAEAISPSADLAAARQLERGLSKRAIRRWISRSLALALGQAGWVEPDAGSLPACTQAAGPLLAVIAVVCLSHNISELEFTTNGLVRRRHRALSR